MTIKKTKFDAAVGELIKLCGFDGSESSTEEFIYLLGDSCGEIELAIDRSHHDGLCWDAHRHLARLLEERGPKAAKAHAKRVKL